jgi:hypothetical protein
MDVDARRRFGRWYTPPPVADLTLALALGPIHDRPQAEPTRIIDPCCGDGVFLTRARVAGIAESSLHGLDIDHAAVCTARSHVPGAQVHCGDLFDQRTLGRFDAVVGNPPYVRQERLSRARKADIKEALMRDFGSADEHDLEQLVGRGDLAAACVLRALSLARPGALVALVVSSALLSADYAAALWRTARLLGRVRAIVDAPAERWFADAAINPIILVIERHPLERDATTIAEPPVTIARLLEPTAQAAVRVRSLDDLALVAEVRRAPAGAPERWLALARAPQVFFEFEARAGDALVPLSQVARVQRGLTSGANDFFYMSRERARELSLEPALLMPLLRSPRTHRTIGVASTTNPYLALLCPPERVALERYPATARYVAEHAHLTERPGMRGRHPWWALPHRPAHLFFSKAYAARFVQHLADTPMVADQRLYTVHPRSGLEPRRLAAVLNSTFTALAIECMGRASMGEGALEWTVADAQRLPILDPRCLSAPAAGALSAAFSAMEHRPVGAISDEHSAADRRLLDRALAKIRPGLAELLDAIWPALVHAVTLRNQRPGRALE